MLPPSPPAPPPPALAELIERARAHVGAGERREALAACDAIESLLGEAAAPATRALLVLWRAATVDDDAALDEPALAAAARTLAGAAHWEDAMYAWSLAAGAARAGADVAGARGHLGAAIGCAEAAGARVFGAGYLARLAALELGQGEPRRALAHVAHALGRLAGVPLQGARLREAELVELAGDAWAALGEREQARRDWRDAHARQERLGRAAAAARLAAKLSA